MGDGVQNLVRLRTTGKVKRTPSERERRSHFVVSYTFDLEYLSVYKYKEDE